MRATTTVYGVPNGDALEMADDPFGGHGGWGVEGVWVVAGGVEHALDYGDGGIVAALAEIDADGKGRHGDIGGIRQQRLAALRTLDETAAGCGKNRSLAVAAR